VLEQARVVRQIFVWVGHERWSLREVCQKLQEQGLATATGQSGWNRSSVWSLLRNPAYRGQAAYGKTRRGPRRSRRRPYRGAPAQPRRWESVYEVPEAEQIAIPVPALVEPELWTAVQEQWAEKRRRHGPRPRPGRYLLTGLVVCGTCGYTYYGKQQVRPPTARGEPRSYAYYRCLSSERRPRGGPRLCHNRSVRADRLDEAVWRDVSSLLREPQRIAQEYEHRLARAPQDDELTAKQAAVQKVQRGLDRLIDAYQIGLLERPQFEPRVRRAREQLQTLHDQIVALQAEQSSREDLQRIIGQVETFRKMLEGSLEQADGSTRRRVITTLVKQIEIHEENVKIVYRIDSLPFAPAPEGGVLQYCWWRERGRDRPWAEGDWLEGGV
jgi:site-specific DNA recombinase